MNEIKTPKTDIGIVAIFTTLCILLFNTSVLNNAEIMTFIKIIMLLLPGYSLLTLIFPTNNINKAKFLLASIFSSLIIVFVLALVLGVFLNLSSGVFINILLIITGILLAIAFIRRLESSKSVDSKYIVCETCGSLYKLQNGESLEDFKACNCGGKLKYDSVSTGTHTSAGTTNLSKIKLSAASLSLVILGIILNSLIGIQLTLAVIFMVIVLAAVYLYKTNNIILKHRFMANFLKYRYLLNELVKRDIKIKYRRSVLGIFWSFLNPLLFMIVLTLIFSVFFARDIPNFPVYILTGRIVFDLYAHGSKAAMTSIRRNSSIIKKVYIPKYMYSLSSVLSNFVTFALSLIVLFMVMIVTNAPFTIYILFAILPIILLLMFTIGAGLILATVTVFFRDIEHLYGVFLTLLMYGSALFYPIDIVPDQYRIFFELNPVYAFISLFRDSFLYGKMFDPITLLYAAVSAVVLLVIGILVFYKYQDRFILYV